MLASAAQEGTPMTFVGAGTSATHVWGEGSVIEMSSANVAEVIDWQSADLTITVGAGMRVGALESMLAARDQTSLLPVADPNRTVGGVVAEGRSGYGRLKYGPTRDRVLEVTLATGYGRVVRGGGRLVKNVTGYDLPRLVTGSMGSLGFISSVCLKLWPTSRSRAVVTVADPVRAHADLFRPFAVIETERQSIVVLEGSEADIERQTESVGGARFEGDLPGPLPQPVVISVRVPAGATPDAIAEVRGAGADGWIGQHGVGIVEAGWNRFDRDDLIRLRSGVAELGGIVVVDRADDTFVGVDRWGVGPQAPAVQKRFKNQFDPARICNPGVLPGGL